MDKHFNKQLTERERIGSDFKFHDVRNCKGNHVFDEDAKGGKVSIHRHRRETSVGRRNFNENLNPLRSFIHRNVGRPWNKVFSELNAVFDRRKVINNHIFEHLFQYVEINAKLIDGKVCVLANHGYDSYTWDPVTRTRTSVENYYDKRWKPIKEHYCEWYVHPIDGLLKANDKKLSKKARREKQAKKLAEAAAKVFRVVDADNHLHFENGTWMVYGIKDRPAQVEQLVAPSTMTDREWRALSKDRRHEVGVRKLIWPDVHEFTAPTGSPERGRYYASRQTASKKLLKQLCLEGTATFDDEALPSMSHREFDKYRKAA